jgi:hypothetical protein
MSNDEDFDIDSVSMGNPRAKSGERRNEKVGQWDSLNVEREGSGRPERFIRCQCKRARVVAKRGAVG